MESRPKLFGVAGQMRMGKDTLGGMIASETGLSTRAFATGVKELTRDLFGIQDIDAWKCRSDNPPGMMVTMRRALQLVGDGMRQISPSIWVDRALADPSGIFCDVRYANEAQEIRRRGGILILIGRSALLNDDPNPSEAYLRPIIAWFLENTTDACVCISKLRECPHGATDFDWFLRNDATVQDLKMSLRDGVLKVLDSDISSCPSPLEE